MRFTRPTIKEIADFAKQNNYNDFDPEYFWNYWEARDWQMTRTVKMKNWKNAVHNWVKISKGSTKKSVVEQMEKQGLL